MGHVSPWWTVQWFDNRFRRLMHNPGRYFGPYVSAGMRVLDVGCGAGFNSLALARLVGPEGRVTAVDIHAQLLACVRRRAERAGLGDRVETHQCERDSIGVTGPFDFALAFWMAHEAPDKRRFFREVHAALEPGGCLFVAEPRFHVSRRTLAAMVAAGALAGLVEHDRPRVAFSRAVVLRKPLDAEEDA